MVRIWRRQSTKIVVVLVPRIGWGLIGSKVVIGQTRQQRGRDGRRIQRRTLRVRHDTLRAAPISMSVGVGE
jgi:hypothetical protein